MSRQPPERDVAPVVQRLRVHYRKTGRLRFASHRDFQRSLERAVRRARIPVAYSAGFSPHPKISYTNAAPTGAASDAEYLELGLARELDPADVRRELDAALPEGFDVIDVVVARTGDFANRLQASLWRVELPGLTVREVSQALTVLRGESPVVVRRVTKNGVREFDIREAVSMARVEDAGDAESSQTAPAATSCAILLMVVRHTTPAVRPDDILNGLRDSAQLPVPAVALMRRLAQGPLAADGVTIGDPLAPDRPVVADV